MEYANGALSSGASKIAMALGAERVLIASGAIGSDERVESVWRRM